MKRTKETNDKILVASMADLEIKAKEKAKETIANQLQRPDQLDKLDQMKKKYSRKKASVESMLKTSIQSQLEGVKTGVTQLQLALKDIAEVRQSLQEASSIYGTISDLSTKLGAVREENARHSQYATAIENVKLFCNAPETIKKCQDYLAEGRFLHAHKCLSDLEISRDDLLFELSRQQSAHNSSDENCVMAYFDGVRGLGEELGKQLWLVMNRMTNTARRDPTAIVTALRIVEREEMYDNLLLKRYNDNGFLPPGRPRRWRQKVFSVLQAAIETRVEASQIEDRQTDKMWLVRHLEVIRQIVLEDLQVVKNVCEPCFPPHYDIMKQYTNMYHTTISQHLSELIKQKLEGNEMVTLLTWTQEYRSKDMLGHPNLHIDLNELGPLLDEETLRQVRDQYLQTIRANLREWMGNSLRSDSKDWYRSSKPDTDSRGYFMTSLPLLLFQMMEQNLQVATLINETLAKNVLMTSFEELAVCLTQYKETLVALKNKHLVNRNEPQFYIQYLIGNINNCDTIAEMIGQMSLKYGKTSTADDEKRCKEITEAAVRMGKEVCDWLLEEVFLDLDQFIQDLLTRKWLASNNAVDTICVTFEDYSQDFAHLKKVFFKATMDKAERRITIEYLRALFGKKIVFKSYEERVAAADKIRNDANQLHSLFGRLMEGKENSGLEAIPPLAEMIKLKDPTMLPLEISGYENIYPDVKVDHLVNFILMRGDINKNEARQTVVSCLGEDHDTKIKNKKTIFSYDL